MDDVTSQVRSILEREMTAKYPNFRFISVDHVSAIAGHDLLSNAIKALLIAFVCMLIYIAIRFSPLSGAAALFALVHDILIMCAFMVFFRGLFQVNSSFIAAILTIVGYSINNTIIIFDRIRENRKRPGMSQMPMMDVVEVSVSSTLARTINTTLTTLITLVCLFIFGVSSIKEFAFPLIIGMLAGTYSSVLLSGQVWAMWDEKLGRKAAKQRNNCRIIRRIRNRHMPVPNSFLRQGGPPTRAQRATVTRLAIRQEKPRLNLFSAATEPRSPADMPEALHRLLIERGIGSAEEAAAFLNPGVQSLHDPFLLNDMGAAADIIRAAMAAGEAICVYGDYDVDGVCASAILTRG